MILGKILNRFVPGVALVVAIVMSGCSGEDPKAPKLVAASGTVKYNGNPIAGANVLFVPAEGTQAMGTTDKDGKFILTTNGRPGAMIGKCKVVISKMVGADGQAPRPMKPEDMAKMASQNKMMPVAKSEIPLKYADLATTKQEADVSADAKTNVFEFILVD